jgi:hypothetical protein
MNKYQPHNFNHYSDQSQIEEWIREDMKDAQMSYQRTVGDIKEYWKEVVEYFRNYLTNNISLEQIKKDLQFGNEAEKYASKILLSRLGDK